VLLSFAAVGDDDVLESALRRFNEEFYRLGASEEERLAAVHALSGRRHEKTVRALSPLLTRSSVPVRILAARVLGGFASLPASSRELRQALRSPANQGKRHSAVRIEVLRALGAHGVKEAVPDVEGLIEDREAWVAKAAVDAAGRLRCPSSVEPLLKALRRIEGPDAEADAGLDPLGRELGDARIDRLVDLGSKAERKESQKSVLREPLLAALRAITRQSFDSARAWEAWWAKAKKTFRVAE
jgi:HEAT repeat protein